MMVQGHVAKQPQQIAIKEATPSAGSGGGAAAETNMPLMVSKRRRPDPMQSLKAHYQGKLGLAPQSCLRKPT